MGDRLIDLINQTQFLSPGDKSFLLESVVKMSPLERLRLEGALRGGRAPEVLQSLGIIRSKFFQSETPKKPDLLSKISDTLSGKKTNTVVAHSFLTQPNLLGSNPPQAVHGEKLKPIATLEELSHPGQLSLLSSRHVTFGLEVNTEQVIQNFLNTLTRIFTSLDNINLRRAYFMNFVESPLFISYINTALTALRHPELQPPKIILNLLYQINQQYLNNKQFQFAAVISNHLRNLSAI